MLVLCYGIPKSGSTIGFELVKGVLLGAGVSQDRLSAPGITKAKNPKKKNFFAKPRRQSLPEFKDTLLRLISAIGPDRMVAVKTHMGAPAAAFAWLEELQARRQLQVIASYRDPRDICLSLVDAPRFARLEDLEIAADHVEGRLRQFMFWASLKGALRLCYETVAFEPHKAIDLIEQTLGVTCDRDHAIKYAFEQAKTPFNKGIPHRHLTDMTDEQKERYTQRFDTFIQKVCVEDDQEWFEQRRCNLLGRAAREDPGDSRLAGQSIAG